MSTNMSVAALIAVVVSLLLEWFPGLRTWWERFSPSQKRGMMAGLVALVSISVAGLNCVVYKTCPADWLKFLLEVFFVFLAAAAAQQSVYALLKRPSPSYLGD